MDNNNQIINKAGMLTTSGVTSGLLNPSQARTFLQEAFDKATLGPLIRRMFKLERKGEIDKIGIASRILRKKIEGIDAKEDGSAPILDPATGQIKGYRAAPFFNKIEYSTEQVRLPWEISNDTIRQNIEGEGIEATITNMMTTRLALELEDIYLNGDESTPATAADGKFLYINDGWVKQIANAGHVYDASGTGGMSLDMFSGALTSLPSKYHNGKLRWIMSPFRANEWEDFLLNKALDNGASVPERMYKAPKSIPIVEVPQMPDDKIVLTDPQNLIVVSTYGTKIIKADNDTESAMQDKRSYVIHLDFDCIIEELDATAIIKNIE